MRVDHIDLLVVGLSVAAFKAKKRAALERLAWSHFRKPPPRKRERKHDSLVRFT